MYGLGLAVEGFRAEGLGLKHLNLGFVITRLQLG